MEYEKRTWVSGVTPCSAENFNHMEEGIAAAHEAINEQNTNKYNKVPNVDLSGDDDGNFIITVRSGNTAMQLYMQPAAALFQIRRFDGAKWTIQNL